MLNMNPALNVDPLNIATVGCCNFS